MNEKQLTDLVAMFKGEATDHLDAINKALLTIERGGNGDHQSLLEEIFRDAHSLKGAARAVGFIRIEAIAHHLESVFGAARRDHLELTPTLCDTLYEGLDIIQDILTQSHGLEEAKKEIDDLLERLEMVRQGQEPPRKISPPPPAPEPKTEEKPVSEEKPVEDGAHEEEVIPVDSTPEWHEVLPESEETIRVNLSKVESLMAQASELLISKINADQRLSDLKQLRADLERQRRELHRYGDLRAASSRRQSDPHLMERIRRYQNLLADFSGRLSQLEKRLIADTMRLSLVSGNLQDGIRRIRMLPFDTILSGFQRMIRDLSREMEKDVILKTEGTEIELDKKVLEEIRDPLMHLLRNAIGHGIEPPEEREAAGKPRHGTIILKVSHQGNRIGILVEDDGRGIDVVAVRRSAIKAKRATREEIDAMSDEDVIRLILLPGLSTSTEVTGLSGRGVGLDVVRQKLDDLQGRIEIESAPGEGTRFKLSVPVSLATTHGLLISIVGEKYAIPLNAIEKVVMVSLEDVHTVEGREMISFNGQPIALVRLVDILERPTRPAEVVGTAPAVVIWAGAVHMAFLVDELYGEQEMVVKPLGKQLRHVRNVAGATLLGTGQIVIILNPLELIRSAQGGAATGTPVFQADKEQESRKLSTILVVDDSITTRTLEKNILEAAGYNVLTAVNGVEAMNYLQMQHCDLVVSDIQMPMMDGFELTATVKANEKYSQLPVILVTSLESPDDRRRGLEAGANAYIVKSAFDQEDLLATIKQLL